MGDRKVLNYYYSPDFDPRLLRKAKKAQRRAKPELYNKDGRVPIRMMLPMSVRCVACGEFNYRGTKYNSLMENAKGEDYLGIEVKRFYMKCTRCKSTFTIKTDPKNADYSSEWGCTRNYDPHKEREDAAREAEAERARQEAVGKDAMSQLEERTKASKHDMDTLDALDELRALNARNQRVSVDAVLALKQAQLA
eukprot:CAMPEP_0198349658 /NCGR_PEP_ID=MMETSP1450-20131203/95005_1 /TAXON_ID=753684 ORGANISM="Madagascaria erythrocladiodes, Strain CCMP3234" /NCGR_SAMPLE_ID=MMETSP1450 /ASSEMBLY_ACC=CAM_ASM_001115 /LENGTH=193 /DNA_ID=CAMNT_0044055357 /DNA_START=76 /DNA_END=654 /DNA_ORIENTATION=+